MKKLALISLLFYFSNTIIFANQFNCPILGHSDNNTLFNISIIGGWSNDVNDPNADEFVPDSEISTKKYLLQIFDLKAKHQKYKKISLMCVYNDRSIKIKEIPKNVNICQKKYELKSYNVSISCW